MKTGVHSIALLTWSSKINFSLLIANNILKKWLLSQQIAEDISELILPIWITLNPNLIRWTGKQSS